MDFAVNQRLNLSERNCINLCERYRFFYQDPKGTVVKYVALDGKIKLEYDNHDSIIIKAGQKISRATKEEVRLYFDRKSLTMTEYVSEEEPVRHVKWAHSKAEGIIIEEWTGKVTA